MQAEEEEVQAPAPEATWSAPQEAASTWSAPQESWGEASWTAQSGEASWTAAAAPQSGEASWTATAAPTSSWSGESPGLVSQLLAQSEGNASSWPGADWAAAPAPAASPAASQEWGGSDASWSKGGGDAWGASSQGDAGSWGKSTQGCFWGTTLRACVVSFSQTAGFACMMCLRCRSATGPKHFYVS